MRCRLIITLTFVICIDFFVVWQSPATITVGTLKNSVMLYCIASLHGSCTYQWANLEDPSVTFPNSPVVYINKGGFYQCTVRYQKQVTQGHVISVEVGT